MKPVDVYSSKYMGGTLAAEVNPKYIELDSQMQSGYKYFLEDNYSEAIRRWAIVWNLIMDAMKQEKVNAFCCFDEIFNGNEFVSNWTNDFDECLSNAVSGRGDVTTIEYYSKMRIQFNEQIQLFIDKDNESAIGNAKRAMAEAEKGEKIFVEHLSTNPKWGWGWIGWSDQYWFFNQGDADYKKGEEILLEALKVKDVEEKECIAERLLSLYQDSGEKEKLLALEKKFKQEDAKNIRKQEMSLGLEKKVNTLQREHVKIGRNKPCPCGSGKKYKKCCL